MTRTCSLCGGEAYGELAPPICGQCCIDRMNQLLAECVSITDQLKGSLSMAALLNEGTDPRARELEN